MSAIAKKLGLGTTVFLVFAVFVGGPIAYVSMYGYGDPAWPACEWGNAETFDTVRCNLGKAAVLGSPLVGIALGLFLIFYFDFNEDDS